MDRSHLFNCLLSVDGHLGYFYLLVIVNSAAVNMYLLLYLFSIPLGLYLGVELLGHMVILCLHFWGTATLFSTETAPFYIPTDKVRGFQFFHILTTLVIFHFLDYSNFSGCEVLSHCGFDVYVYPRWLVGLSIFSCAYWLCVYIFFWRNVHFEIGCCLLSSGTSLYILDAGLLSDM